MRTIIFLIIIFFFIGSGTWLIYNKDITAPYEIPYLNKSSFSLPITQPKIVPVEKWESILEGKWNYNFSEPIGRTTHTMIGEVEFKDDRTFLRYITWKSFTSENDFENNDPDIIAGGSYSGTWKIKDETWVEKVSNCTVTNTRNDTKRNLDVCGVFYRLNDVKTYGQFNDKIKKSKIIQFNNKKVVIKSKSFSTGKTSSYVLTRIAK